MTIIILRVLAAIGGMNLFAVACWYGHHTEHPGLRETLILTNLVVGTLVLFGTAMSLRQPGR